MSRNYDWAPVDPANWKDVPFIENRLATEEDVRCGRAVFYVEGGERQFITSVRLPALAELTRDDGVTEIVIVIQVEAMDGDERSLTAGYRMLDGGNGVAMLNELRLVHT